MDDPPPPRYRIEHREPGFPPLAVGAATSPQAASAWVERVVAQFRRRGGVGEIVAVDEATGDVVARVEI